MQLVVERKLTSNLNLGDVLYESVGNLSKKGYVLDSKMRDVLLKHKVIFIPTLNNLKNAPPSEELVKEHLLETSSHHLGTIEDFKKDIFQVLNTIYKPFSETDSSFDNRKKKKQITCKVLFHSQIQDIFRPDIESGSLSIIPPHKIISLQKILLEIYRYFNGLREQNHADQSEKHFPRQTYTSVRLKPIYQRSLNKIESLGDAVICHAIDTSLYFLATLSHINKIRSEKGLPLSGLKYFIDSGMNSLKNQEFCYKSDIIVNAALGALLAPLGYMHTSYTAILAKGISSHTKMPIDKETRDLLRKVSLVGFNLIRSRDDISPIAKLIVRKQDFYLDGSGENFLKDTSPLHEFIRLYQIISFYDKLTNPFLSYDLISRQDCLNYMKNLSEVYNEETPLFSSDKRFDSKMLEYFMRILAPYDIYETLYLVHKNNPASPIYKGYITNYTYQNCLPHIRLTYDYVKEKDLTDLFVVISLQDKKIKIFKEKKLQKEMIFEPLKDLRIQDYQLSPINLSEFKDPIFSNITEES